LRPPSPGDKAALDSIQVPRKLEIAGAFIVIALTFDLLQYAWRSASWGILGWWRERKDPRDSPAPRWINWPSIACLCVKTAAMGTAYAYIGAEVNSYV
jgi:hypothetical protein